MEILASRMLLRPADYDRSLRFYRDEPASRSPVTTAPAPSSTQASH